MSSHLERARILLEQSRYDLAEKELQQALAEDPSDPFSHALLSLTLSETKRAKEATAAAETAIGFGPDLPLAHYALATALQQRNRFREAEVAARNAIELDPENPDLHGMLAGLALNQRQWRPALEAAEAGLRIDPEHVTCNNLRAVALVKLGNRQAAGATIDAALARDPQNSLSHANRGWTLLEDRRPKQAMEHFREALRIDPNNGWARAGIVEALKARNIIYRLLLQYMLWMDKLSGRAQWGVVLGVYFLQRYLSAAAGANPDWAPWIYCVLALLIAFAVMTWIGKSFFNLLLRLNRFGRLALSAEQVRASNWLGLCLLAAGTSLAVGLATGAFAGYVAALLFGFLAIPVSGTFHCRPGWPRLAMGGYTTGLAGLALCTLAPEALFLLGQAEWAELLVPISVLSFRSFLWGLFLSMFLGNFLMQQVPRR